MGDCVVPIEKGMASYLSEGSQCRRDSKNKKKSTSFLEHIETVKLLAMDMLFLIKITLIGERSKKMKLREEGSLKPKTIQLIKGSGMKGN